MARPARPERSTSARPSRQLSRFYRSINSDMVFGTHYGLFANANRAENIATARALLNVAPPAADPQEQPDIATDAPRVLPCPCPRCAGRMIVIETFAPGCEPRRRPLPVSIDTPEARTPASLALFSFRY